MEEKYKDLKDWKKTHLKKKAEEILRKNHRGSIIKGDDELFLREFFKRHHDYQIKVENIGGIISMISVNKSPGKYNNNCFYIHGENIINKDDISIQWCYNPRVLDLDEREIKSAFRNVIEKFKDSIKQNNNNIIHHHKRTFKQIINIWRKQNPNLDLKVNKTIQNSCKTYFINEETKKSFFDFHNKFAILLEVSLEDHKRIHSEKLEKESLKVLESKGINFLHHDLT